MTATNPFYVGLDFNTFYNNTAGGGVIGGTQQWVSLSNIRDLKRGSTLKEADVSSRDNANTGTKLGLLEPGLDYRTIEFDIITDETDAAYLFLRTQKEARAALELALANGPIGTAGSVA